MIARIAFATRSGNALHIASCPFCGCQHRHGSGGDRRLVSTALPTATLAACRSACAGKASAITL